MSVIDIMSAKDITSIKDKHIKNITSIIEIMSAKYITPVKNRRIKNIMSVINIYALWPRRTHFSKGM